MVLALGMCLSVLAVFGWFVLFLNRGGSRLRAFSLALLRALAVLPCFWEACLGLLLVGGALTWSWAGTLAGSPPSGCRRCC